MEEIRKIVQRIESLKKQLNALNINDTKNEDIKISYFKHTGWDKVEFNIEKGKPVYNMIMHQVRLDLESELIEKKNKLKKLTNAL